MAGMEKRAGGEEEFLLSLLRPLVVAKVYKVTAIDCKCTLFKFESLNNYALSIIST